MSIRINRGKCIGCSQCVEICPGNLIHFDEQKKAFIKFPKDCWGCTSCLKECGAEAIDFYLGADIGGNGSMMHTVQEGSLLHWYINTMVGDTVHIKADSKESNQY